MNDTRLKSLSEVALNIIVGFCINFCINCLVFPFFGIPFDLLVYLQIGGFYTITSIIVSYPLRRLFDRFYISQSIKGSALESVINTAVSWLACFATGVLVLPHYGVHSTVDVGIINTIGTITTTLRRFFFRRLFERFGKNENLYTLTVRLYNRAKKA